MGIRNSPYKVRGFNIKALSEALNILELKSDMTDEVTASLTRTNDGDLNKEEIERIASQATEIKIALLRCIIAEANLGQDKFAIYLGIQGCLIALGLVPASFKDAVLYQELVSSSLNIVREQCLAHEVGARLGMLPFS